MIHAIAAKSRCLRKDFPDPAASQQDSEGWKLFSLFLHNRQAHWRAIHQRMRSS
jgi:hypothetical protein